MTTNTAIIVKEFSTLIDEDTVYTLTEMKKVLSEVYKTTNATAKKSRKKKNDDEEKPKRAPTAYNIFFKEMRPIVKEQNPEMDNKELMTAIALLWKKKKEEEEDPKTNKED